MTFVSLNNYSGICLGPPLQLPRLHSATPQRLLKHHPDRHIQKHSIHLPSPLMPSPDLPQTLPLPSNAASGTVSSPAASCNRHAASRVHCGKCLWYCQKGALFALLCRQLCVSAMHTRWQVGLTWVLLLLHVLSSSVAVIHLFIARLSPDLLSSLALSNGVRNFISIDGGTDLIAQTRNSRLHLV